MIPAVIGTRKNECQCWNIHHPTIVCIQAADVSSTMLIKATCLERHGVLNHQQLDCWIYDMLRLPTMETLHPMDRCPQKGHAMSKALLCHDAVIALIGFGINTDGPPGEWLNLRISRHKSKYLYWSAAVKDIWACSSYRQCIFVERKRSPGWCTNISTVSIQITSRTIFQLQYNTYCNLARISNST